MHIDRVLRWAVCGLVCALGCSHARLDDPPLAMTVSVVGLREDEREHLAQQICAIEGVQQCAIKQADVAVDAPAKRKRSPSLPPPPQAEIVFSFRGALGELRAQIAALPHPGLQAKRADVTLSYRGFDNLAPTLTLNEPSERAIVAQPRISVVVTSADVDVALVTIAGIEALTQSGGRYVGDAELLEGDNVVVVKATDTAGNARTLDVHVGLDTTPPELNVAVEILAYDKARVKGTVKDAATVSVDGRVVEVDFLGRFEREIAVDPDKSMLEVSAKDALGNSVVIRRSAKIASSLDASSK